jgi:hypothetical protein
MTTIEDTSTARNRELERQKMRDAAKHLGAATLRDGSWFARTVATHVKKHCELMSGAYWEKTYPGLDPEERADREIHKTAWKAAGAGMLASVGASTGELLALFTEGLAAPVGVPAAAVSMAGEGAYTALHQIDLACDIASIYGVPFDGDDVGEVATLFALALDIELEDPDEEQKRKAEHKDEGMMERLMELEEGEVATRIGRKLLEEAVMRNILPIVNVPISARWNYVATKKLGQHVKRYVRYRRAITAAVKKLRFDKITSPGLLVEGCWLLATSDGDAGNEEVMALAMIMDLLDPQQRAAIELDKQFGDDEEQWFDELANIAPDMVDPLLDTLFLVAATDKELVASERRFLRRVGRTVGREVDLGRISRICAHLAEGDELPDDVKHCA